MKLKPLEDRIVVKPNEAETKTSGGIVLPESAKESSCITNVNPKYTQNSQKRFLASLVRSQPNDFKRVPKGQIRYLNLRR